MNPLKMLAEQGQAVWLDFLARRFVADGSLKQLIERDGLTGVTSNPAIFEKAIEAGGDYDDALAAAESESDQTPIALYESLAIADVQHTADVLRPVYDANERRDGFVSLEVSPYLANDTAATIAEARRLWYAVRRENLMIKVPGTAAGLPAIRQLLGEGINVNITLLFSQAVYAQVADAYVAGAERFAADGGDLTRLASVASFFVSRIDTEADREIADSGDPSLAKLAGKVAIANAKLAYRHYKRLIAGPRWAALAAKGARPQRLLWASTGTKNKAYSDVLYVESLIGKDTVNTIPPATMDAFRDHGKVAPTIEQGLAEAEEVMTALARGGISIDKICDQLVVDGVRLFADAADRLLGAVARKRVELLDDRLDRQTAGLPPTLQPTVEHTLEAWRGDGKGRRLWARDAAVWTGSDEASWLGWLDCVERARQELEPLAAFADEVKRDGFTHVLLLGMGGSSLGPEVIGQTFGARTGHPALLVLNSTDPAQIRSFERRSDPAHTLYIVASKSGTTLEPNILMQYFFARAEAALGAGKAGAHFVAITDPGSKLAREAAERKFRRVFLGDPSIGGRYSVLSPFGLVPAAAIGVDIARLVEATAIMVRSCDGSAPPADNPGIALGAALGVAAKAGRDKLTIFASPGLADFGAWLEQLVAESTGKHGHGIVPIDAESAGAPKVYGDDRVFAHIRLAAEADEPVLSALEAAGHPVVRIVVTDRYHLGQEFFRWEIATAVAGAVIGINPFDQPDVEASKNKTRELTAAVAKTGRLPAETPVFSADGLALYADPKNAAAIGSAAREQSLAGWLGAHLARLGAGDYCAFLAYLERSPAHIAQLQAVRMAVRDRKHVATCLEFGPRFLHSTGQAYKGGPNSGVFLQITCDDAEDLAVPEQKYSFGIVKAAQARGDYEVLAERGRRALRIHLGRDVEAGLAALSAALRQGLA